MRKNFWCVLAVILLVSSGLVFGTAVEIPKKAVKSVQKGDESLVKKEFDKALEAYDNAIKLAPEYAAAYYGKGRLYLAQNNTEEAIKNLDKALELDPENAEPKKFYGQNLFQWAGQALNQRQLAQSNTYFLKLVSIPGIDGLLPDMYQKSLFQMATNYFLQQKNADSNQYYLQLLAVPGFETANKRLYISTVYQVGANYSALKDYKKAGEYFTKLLEFPELQTEEFRMLNISVLYMAGLNADMAGEYQQCIEYIGKFLPLGETSAEHAQFMPLANFLMGSANMKLLQKEVEKIEEKDKKIEKAAELAKTKPEIETYLNKAIELKPDLEPAYTELGNYYYFCNNLEKTITTYKTIIEKFPSSPDLDQYKKFLENIEKAAQPPAPTKKPKK